MYIYKVSVATLPQRINKLLKRHLGIAKLIIFLVIKL